MKTHFSTKIEPRLENFMEPDNDFKSLFAVMAADWPICHTHMQTSADKQNTQHCSQVLQSKRTVFPVTVKKSSSAKARNASSNISLVIAFGKKERNKCFTYIKYSFTYFRDTMISMLKNHQFYSFFWWLYIYFYVPTEKWQTFHVKGQMTNTIGLASVINYSTVPPTTNAATDKKYISQGALL